MFPTVSIYYGFDTPSRDLKCLGKLFQGKTPHTRLKIYSIIAIAMLNYPYLKIVQFCQTVSFATIIGSIPKPILAVVLRFCTPRNVIERVNGFSQHTMTHHRRIWTKANK